MDIINKLADPTLKWYVKPIFGKYRIYDPSNSERTLSICDEVLCIPIRFSETLKWHDGTATSFNNVFANVSEAWDHTKDTSPNTSAPYNGKATMVYGYGAWMAKFEATDGTNKNLVHVIRRTYPQDEILIFNVSGTINIVVNDPLVSGYNVSTNGTRGTGTTTIAQGQYVLFYKGSTPSEVDTTNALFATSPISVNKTYAYEVYDYLLQGGFNTNVKIYTGIKAPKDIPVALNAHGGSATRGTENVSSINRDSITGANFLLYDNEPLGGTWAEGVSPAYITLGWAEDDAGNVKFIYFSEFKYKHSVDWIRRVKYLIMNVYNADMDEWVAISKIIPLVSGVYSYGQAGAVIHPELTITDKLEIWGYKNITYRAYIDPSDNLVENPTASSLWTYRDGWACADTTDYNISGMVAHLGIWTDDTNLKETNPKNTATAQSSITQLINCPQIKKWMDTYLAQGKTYLLMSRWKIVEGSITGTDFKNWATKVQPRVLSDAEVSSLINSFPFIHSTGIPISSQISISAPNNTNPNSTITVSGNAGVSNKTVYVIITDANGQVINYAQTTSGADGSFSVNITTPTNTGNYKVYVVVIP